MCRRHPFPNVTGRMLSFGVALRPRRTLGAAIAIGVLLTAATPAWAAGPSGSLAEQLTGAIAAFPGSASVVVVDPHGPFRFMWQPDRVVRTASLYKLGVMAEAYRQAAANEISLDGTTVEISDEDVGEDYFTPPGTVLTVRDAVERMITLSDNAPAHALLRLVDTHKVNRTFIALGMLDTRINAGLPPEEQTDTVNTTTARDIARFFMLLVRGNLVAPAESAEMLGVLSRQKINDRLSAGVPEGTTIAHKTGDLDGISHDAGVIFRPAGPRIAVVLTTDYRSFDDVVTLNEKVGALAYAAELDAFAARYALVSGPAQPASVRAPLSWLVRVTNAGGDAWDDTNYVRVSLSSAAAPAARALQPLALPPLPPGASASLAVTSEALPAGIYLLELEVYDEYDGGSGNRFPIVFEVR